MSVGRSAGGSLNGIHRFGAVTCIQVRGKDRKKVLHNLCTNEINGLVPGQGYEVFFTNVKGRTVGHGIVYDEGESLRIVGVGGQSEKLLPHLDRYVITEDVVWDDQSSSVAALLVAGDSAQALFDRSGLAFATSPLYHAGVSDILGDPSVVVQTRWIDDREALVLVPVDQLDASMERLAAALSLTDGQRIDDAMFTASRVSRLSPIFGIDFNDENLPQEVHRDAVAINFRKGCYLGQETVARLDALGQVQKQLELWELPAGADVKVGDELWNGEKPVARVTSIAMLRGNCGSSQ